MLKIVENEPMATHSTFQIGGNARFAAWVDEIDDLREAIDFAGARNIPFRAIGGGSNLLVADEGYTGLVIFIKNSEHIIDSESGRVRSGAGVLTAQLAGETARVGLAGFEWAVGIPGTIGGSLYGNSGAGGVEIKDVVLSVTCVENGAVFTLNNADCEFRYRGSRFKNGGIIWKVELQLKKDENPSAPQKRIRDALRYRIETQPKGFASNGCIFKNPIMPNGERISAGKLIDEAGMKGVVEGGVRVSDIHANFMLKDGVATATNVLKLIERVREVVFDKFNIRLEEEITILRS